MSGSRRAGNNEYSRQNEIYRFQFIIPSIDYPAIIMNSRGLTLIARIEGKGYFTHFIMQL
jgi:hypothetical protein